jgi:catechol 2,3-dioxygenase-like lactoylglutathione lyase family enzyme
MPITGLSHVTFIGRDLERTARLWRDGLGAIEVYDSARRNLSLSREKFFLVGGVWVATMQGEPTPRSYKHVAFKVSEAELPAFESRLRSLGIEVRPPRPRVDGEGVSLYFYDYDDNLIELHSGSLEERLERYKNQP